MERGGCSFIRKTRNVQEIGGAMTLIVNNKENANPEHTIMIDDGTGLNVAIPTIMISKEDGDLIKESIRQTEESNKNPGRRKEYTVLLIDFEIVFCGLL